MRREEKLDTSLQGCDPSHIDFMPKFLETPTEDMLWKSKQVNSFFG